MAIRTPLLFISIFCILSGALRGGPSVEAAATSPERPLVIGYSTTVFFSVDPRDAVGLTKVWVKAADRAMKNDVPSSVIFFKGLGDVARAIKNQEVDIVVLTGMEYAQSQNVLPLKPVLSAEHGRNFYDQLLLLVRGDSGISRVGQLRGKTLKIESGQRGTLPTQWLDALLLERTGTLAASFFGTLTEAQKAQQVIMPLFFKQIDACLTSRDSLETMSELNPQIGREIRILEISPGFLSGVLAVPSTFSHPRRDAMLAAIRNIHLDAKGRQLLTVFRINRLVDFKAEHLASLDAIQKESRARSGKPLGSRRQ